MSSAVYTSSQQRSPRHIIPDLIRYRRLLLDVVSKELRARYRNAMMGFLWAVLQPVLMMLILTFVFGFLLQGIVASKGIATERSYAVFLLCGLVPWQFMASALSRGAGSLPENQDLIKKVHFPREIIPLAAVINCVINVLIGFVTLFVVLALLEGIGMIGRGVLYVPIIFAVEFALAAGLALLFSALNVYYQDIAYLIEVALAFGFYATPILYPLPKSMAVLPVSPGLQHWLYELYLLNPMANLIVAFRQAILDNVFPDPILLLRPAIIAAGALLLGAITFRRAAPTFADYL